MNQKTKASFIAWRFYLVLSLILIAVAGLGWRIFDLAILDQHFLRHQGDERFLRLVNTPGFRGMIVDRNGFPLAVSTSVYSVWANPQEFDTNKEQRGWMEPITRFTRPNCALSCSLFSFFLPLVVHYTADNAFLHRTISHHTSCFWS